MDGNTMSQIGLGGGIISLLTFLWGGIQYMNHRNIRSHCCGKTAEVGIDIDTPKQEVAPPEVAVPVSVPSGRSV
jgi:hypothetical protein